MKKLSIVIPVIFVLLLNFVSSLSVSAYSSSDSFYSSTIRTSRSFSFTDNGVLLLHSFYKTSVDVSILPLSSQNLDLSYFSEGTWQGSPISELSSSKLCDQSSTVGFSQTCTMTSDGKYFIYSVLICLPCVAGDSFTITRESSSYADSSSYAIYTSQIYGATGIKKVYNMSNAVHTDSLSYTLKSDNQHFLCFFTADLYSSNSTNGAFDFRYDSVGSDYSNITRIDSSKYASVYSSNYGLNSGSKLSFHLQDEIKAWSFTVFEIFTDGKYYPGYDDGSSDEDDPGGSGSGGSVDLSKIEKYLHDILSVISGFDFHAPDPHEFWEVYKSGLVELWCYTKKVDKKWRI